MSDTVTLDAAGAKAIADAILEGLKKTGGTSTSSNSSNPTNKYAEKVLGAAATTLERLLNKAGGDLVAHTKTVGGVIPILGALSGVASDVVGYLQDTNTVFEGLSKVGAGANGSLSELRLGAAETRMSLGEFANMISTNTAQLAGFAGGVNGGTKRFRELSDAMFSGDNPLIENFQRLGMSINESNEFILKNMESQRRQARFQGPGGNEAMLEASLRMVKSLDVMAKVSGRQAKDMQDEVIVRQRNGSTNAKLRLLEQQGVAGAAQAFKEAQSSLGAAPKVARDLLDDLVQTGVPMTQATKDFAATNAEAYAALVQQANAIKQGDAETAAKKGAEVTAATAAYANSTQGLTISTLGQMSSLAKGQADVLESTAPLIDAIKANQDKMKAETGVTATFLESYNEMLANLSAEQIKQLSGVVPGQEAGVVLQKAQLELAQTASKLNIQIADQMKLSNDLQGKFSVFMDTIIAGAKGAAAIAGGTVAGVGGGPPTNLIQEDTDNYKKYTNANSSAEEKAAARTALGDFIDEQGKFVQAAIKAKLAQMAAGKFTSNENIFTDRAAGGSFNKGDMLRVGERGVETMVAGFDGAVIPNMKNMMNRMPDMAKRIENDMSQTGVPMSRSAKDAMATMSNNDLAAIKESAQLTNALLSQLIGVNTTQARTGEKHLRSARGAGNLMTGLGRA